MAGKIKLEKSDISKFITLTKGILPVDFTDYAPQSFKRRLEHLLSSYGMENLEDLVKKLKTDMPFREKCINDITVNTTELFRDTQVWLQLKKNILPKFKDKPTINIWHAGCSSGEEVYSMMILLSEAGLLNRAKIFATDLNTDILKRAQRATYEARLQYQYLDAFDKVVKINPLNFEEEKDVPYDKYFEMDEKNKTITIKKQFRDKVIFRQHNLVEGKVFYKFDLIFCRNVIIYFNNELQNKVISLFHKSLFDQGMLLIGSHESIGYIPIASKFKNHIMRGLYQKTEA